MSDRPRSAIRRPGSARARPGSARGGAPAPAPVDYPDEDAYWLFSTAYCLTTTDISLAGFTSAVLFDAARWRPVDGDELSPEVCAASEIAYTLGFPESKAAASVTSKHKREMLACFKHAFQGRGGDLLIVFQNMASGDNSALGDGPEADVALNIVARVVDCINLAYSDLDGADCENLAGVSVVLEGFARSGMFKVEGTWDNGETIDYDVQAFTDALPA
ncbi:hypothetical protein CYMTET_51745 [Cymbomonas tetramitiformis]|uniref:Uncharacterized protein n=1 Tax=Cymbomonas tetramitiformis TaxID=36881 RepID=A0AAE0BLK7_9CHLO|nr:hypothetical protein CYMTET_51745 [Cymbomonas tetramitiformis]